MKWSKSGKAQKQLEAKFESGDFGPDTKPKDAWLADASFQQYATDIFRTHFSSEKKKRGLHLQMVKFEKDSENDPEEAEVHTSPMKKFKTDKNTLSPRDEGTLPLLSNSWYSTEMERYNFYVVSPWSHPETSINFVDYWINLPSGVSSNEEYSVKISECGTKLFLYINWPDDLTNKDILVKIGQIKDPELTHLHPCVS